MCRSALSRALGAALLLVAATGGAASPPAPELVGPACREAGAPTPGPVVNVLSLAELAPERAQRIELRRLLAASRDAVIAIDPRAGAPSAEFEARLEALGQRRLEAFARLQVTPPELLPNGLYRLDLGDAFLESLVAVPGPDGTLVVGHAAPSAPAGTEEERP